MNDSYIISKMSKYTFQLNKQIGGWLTDKLPKIIDNWWEELIVNTVTSLQRGNILSNNITDINGLDLAMLLRVLDRNWFVITSSFFINNRERNNIRRMQEVRNSWAYNSK